MMNTSFARQAESHRASATMKQKRIEMLAAEIERLQSEVDVHVTVAKQLDPDHIETVMLPFEVRA